MYQGWLMGMVSCLVMCMGLGFPASIFAQSSGMQSGGIQTFVGAFPVLYSTGPSSDGGEYSRTQYLLERQAQWFDTLTQQTFGGPSLDQAIGSGRAYIPYSSIQPGGAIANRYGTIMGLPLPPVYSANKIELIAHVKSTLAEGAIPARDVHMVIFGSSGNAEVNFVDSIYAENYAFLSVGGSPWKNLRGALVKQFNNFRTISIYLEDGKVSLWLQGDGSTPDTFLFKDRPYVGAVGKVQGIALDFKGSASIDWISLKSNGVVVLEEGFNVPGTTTATIILQSGTLMTGAVLSPVLTGYAAHNMNIVRSIRYNDPGMIEDKSQLQVLREQEKARQIAIKKANDKKTTAQIQACEIGIGGIGAYSPEYRKQLIDKCQGITPAHTGDPIDLSNGAMTAHETLISLPSVKRSRVDFDISYNSRREYPSPVGYNRDHNHNIIAYLDETTNEFILQYDGSSAVFQPIGSQPDADSSTGIIKPVRRNPATRGLASLDVAGNLEISYPDKSRQVFVLAKTLAASATTGGGILAGVPQGSMYKIWIDQNSDGSATTYHYDEYARLRMIVTPFDQSIVLMYHDQGQISRVFDSLGRSVNLSYTPVSTKDGSTQYQLTNIYRKYGDESRTVSYGYTSGLSDFFLDGNMVSLTDTQGQTYVTNTYSSDDRVIKQQYGDEVYQYTYTLNDKGGVDTNTVNSANGSTTVYDFDEWGQVLSRETQTSAGSARSAYEYDDKLRMTRQTNADGIQMQYSYDSYDNLSQLIYTNPDGQSRTRTYRYHPQTRQIQEQTDPLGRKTTYTRDQRGRVTKIQQQSKTRQYSYDTQGQIVQHTDPMGVVQTMTYSKGRASSMTQGGITVRMGYNQEGNLTSLTDGRGNVWRIQLTPRGQISKTISPGGIEQTMSYDGLNNLIKTTLVETNGQSISTSLAYQIQDLVTSITRPGGDAGSSRTTTMEYGAHQLLKSVVSPKGVKKEYGYDELDRLIKVSSEWGMVNTGRDDLEGRPQGTGSDDGLPRPNPLPEPLPEGEESVTMAYQYDNMGRLISVTDPNGNETRYEYDGRGQIRKVVDAQGGNRAMSYDSVGRVTAVRFVDADGQILKHKTMEYDGYDKIVKVVEKVEMGTGRDDGLPRPGEIITQYAYDLNDNLIKLTDPKGGVIRMEYDALNRFVKQIDRLGNTTQWQYDGNGNMVMRSEERSEEGQKIRTSYAYDKDNRLIGTTNQLGQSQSIRYNHRNQPMSITDAKGIVTRYEYNPAGELSKSIKNDGKQAVVTTYEYDAHGNLVRLLDAKGNETKRDYDFMDRPVALTYDDGKQLQYARDPNSNLVSRTDPNGTIVTNTYDELNRLIQRQILPRKLSGQAGQGVGGVSQETYQYDGLGRLIYATDDQGQDVSFSYDGVDRLVSETNNTQTVGYVYDNNSNLTQLRYPSGRTVERSFDANDRTLTVNSNGGMVNGKGKRRDNGSPRPSTIKEYRYDSLKLLSELNGNKTSTSYAYDELMRVKQLTHTTTNPAPYAKIGYEYTYDAIGQITSDGWDMHSYDDMGQITKTNYNVGSQVIGSNGRTQNPLPTASLGEGTQIDEWIYDAMGNRKTANGDWGMVNGFDRQKNAKDRVDSSAVAEAISLSEDESLDRQDISMSNDSIESETDLEGMVAMNDEGGYDTQIWLADNDQKKVETKGRSAGAESENNQKKGEEKRSEEKEKNKNNDNDKNKEPSESNREERCKRKSSRDKSGGGDGRRKKCSEEKKNNQKSEENKKDKDNDKNDQKKSEKSDQKSDDRIDSEDNDDDDQKKSEKIQKKGERKRSEENNKNDNNHDDDDDEPSESNREERCKRKASRDKSGGGDGRRKKCTGRDDGLPRPETNTYQYTTNTLNQYTSIQNHKGKTIVEFKYDANGNMISNGQFEFQYDYKNRLIRAVKNENPEGSEGPDRRKHDDDDDDDDDARGNNRPLPNPPLQGREPITVTMSYDVLGRRVEKRVDNKANEGETVRYTYAGADAISEDWDYPIGEGRELTKELIYGQGIDDVISFIVTRNNKSEQYRYHKNHQTSVIAITDSKGKVVESYRYDTFGNLIQGFQKNSIKQSLVPGATNKPLGESKMRLKNDRLYTAREYDEELGLYYYRGRHYDPRIGRFMQRDPIGLADDVNLYRYVGNSAVNYTDPWGLKSKQVVSNQSNLQIVQKFMTEVGNQCIQNTSTSSLAASCLLGDFKTSESTACDLAVQIACGEVPILPDLRDTAAALYHCPGQTFDACMKSLGLSAVGYVPVVGALKYSDEVVDLYKKTDETIKQGIKNGADLSNKEIQNTLQRISQNSPQIRGDGKIFQNREGLLPNNKDPTYYKERNVSTPGLEGRGTKRIVQGKNGELYYTDDHYNTFTVAI